MRDTVEGEVIEKSKWERRGRKSEKKRTEEIRSGKKRMRGYDRDKIGEE